VTTVERHDLDAKLAGVERQYDEASAELENVGAYTRAEPGAV